jgi:hypothetical protein
MCSPNSGRNGSHWISGNSNSNTYWEEKVVENEARWPRRSRVSSAPAILFLWEMAMFVAQMRMRLIFLKHSDTAPKFSGKNKAGHTLFLDTTQNTSNFRLFPVCMSVLMFLGPQVMPVNILWQMKSKFVTKDNFTWKSVVVISYWKSMAANCVAGVYSGALHDVTVTVCKI